VQFALYTSFGVFEVHLKSDRKRRLTHFSCSCKRIALVLITLMIAIISM